uniref:(northern house mosquito) hypothetical protein n=1 Tax=Culex pipiens TaxID=7175 RepID=A0A8D8BES9_CULPI
MVQQRRALHQRPEGKPLEPPVPAPHRVARPVFIHPQNFGPEDDPAPFTGHSNRKRSPPCDKQKQLFVDSIAPSRLDVWKTAEFRQKANWFDSDSGGEAEPTCPSSRPSTVVPVVRLPQRLNADRLDGDAGTGT